VPRSPSLSPEKSPRRRLPVEEVRRVVSRPPEKSRAAAAGFEKLRRAAASPVGSAWKAVGRALEEGHADRLSAASMAETLLDKPVSGAGGSIWPPAPVLPPVCPAEVSRWATSGHPQTRRICGGIMEATSTPTPAATSPSGRGFAKGNRLGFEPGRSGNPSGLRGRYLIEALAEQLFVEMAPDFAPLSAIDGVLLKQACVLSVRSRRVTDPDAAVRMASESRRTLEGLRRRAKQSRPVGGSAGGGDDFFTYARSVPRDPRSTDGEGEP
jgi:hypothetical protein